MRKFAACVWLAAMVWAAAGLASDIGVIILMGKGGTNGEKSPIAPVIQALENAGYLVEAPEAPWARARYLARDYEESMAEIDQAVDKLKARGAWRIVVGGQSMGANAALGYGARRDGLAGILALSPGHMVESASQQKLFAESLSRARAMVAAGKGGEVAEFQDNNNQAPFKARMAARVYVDWFDPNGPSLFPRNAAALKASTPLLWLQGDHDQNTKNYGKSYAFAKAPPHPKSAYVVVPGGHLDSAGTAADKVVAWIQALD